MKKLRRYDLYGRQILDTEPDLLAVYTDYPAARDQIKELADALASVSRCLGWITIPEGNLHDEAERVLEQSYTALRNAGRI